VVKMLVRKKVRNWSEGGDHWQAFDLGQAREETLVAKTSEEEMFCQFSGMV
jgi:hypothetical protein